AEPPAGEVEEDRGQVRTRDLEVEVGIEANKTRGERRHPAAVLAHTRSPWNEGRVAVDGQGPEGRPVVMREERIRGTGGLPAAERGLVRSGAVGMEGLEALTVHAEQVCEVVGLQGAQAEDRHPVLPELAKPVELQPRVDEPLMDPEAVGGRG